MKRINSTCIGGNISSLSIVSNIIATKDHFLLLIPTTLGIKNILFLKLKKNSIHFSTVKGIYNWTSDQQKINNRLQG